MKRRRKRKDRCRAFNLLAVDGPPDLGGFQFVLCPTQDPIAWLALQHYASITTSAATRQALLVWLREHPCPGAPAVEQMSLDLPIEKAYNESVETVG